MTDNSIIQFGKHKGKKMIDVPADYLIWIFENDKCPPHVAKYISDNYDVLVKEIDESPKKYGKNK